DVLSGVRARRREVGGDDFVTNVTARTGARREPRERCVTGLEWFVMSEKGGCGQASIRTTDAHDTDSAAAVRCCDCDDGVVRREHGCRLVSTASPGMLRPGVSSGRK